MHIFCLEPKYLKDSIQISPHLQKGILWTNDHNFPFVYVIVIYQTS